MTGLAVARLSKDNMMYDCGTYDAWDRQLKSEQKMCGIYASRTIFKSGGKSDYVSIFFLGARPGGSVDLSTYRTQVGIRMKAAGWSEGSVRHTAERQKRQKLETIAAWSFGSILMCLRMLPRDADVEPKEYQQCKHRGGQLKNACMHVSYETIECGIQTDTQTKEHHCKYPGAS